MKTILSLLMALVMVISMSHGAVVKEDNSIAIVSKQSTPLREEMFRYETVALELPPVEKIPSAVPAPVTEPPVEETLDREGEGVTAPPAYETESVCNPPVEETQPEEGTIDLEGEGVACPPPCEPAPISDEEPEVPEETIALEPDPIVGPPVEEP